MDSKEMQALLCRMDRLDGELAVTVLLLKELLNATPQEVRESALAAASRGLELGLAKSLGSPHASDDYVRGIELGKKLFRLSP